MARLEPQVLAHAPHRKCPKYVLIFRVWRETQIEMNINDGGEGANR